MTIRQQIITDVERLPERSLHLVSVLVKEIISMESKSESVRPPFKFGGKSRAYAYARLAQNA